MTITDNSATSAIPLMECMKNDGLLFEAKPDLDPTKTLAVLPFSSGTTGPPKGKCYSLLSHNLIIKTIKSVLTPSSGLTAQCARTDLNKRFLPKLMTTTG